MKISPWTLPFTIAALIVGGDAGRLRFHLGRPRAMAAITVAKQVFSA